METYATAVLFAIPFFLLLIGLEWIVARWRGLKVMNGVDTLSSLSSGTTNTIKTVLGLTVAIVTYDWMVEHLAIWQVEATWLAVLVTFLAKDFGGYWNHRWNHEINVLWNRHIVHHSSEEYNLSCALRQSISVIWDFFALFMLPAAIIGVPTEVVAIVAPLHLFAQFWYHTKVIDKLPGWFEYVFVTPSHHRVHHAINDEYIDRNYSEVLIIWDRMFGTFQPELADVPAVYGTKKPVSTWNPFLINIQHLWQLVQDAWHTKHWRDKLRIWFMPTGWRPADVAERYPLSGVLSGAAVYAQTKYDSQPSQAVHAFGWTQFVVVQLLMLHLFTHIGEVSWYGGLCYGAVLLLTIFSLTSLLDGSWLAWLAELLKLGLLLGVVLSQGDWFGLGELLPGSQWLLLGYGVVSLALTFWLSQGQNATSRKYSH